MKTIPVIAIFDVGKTNKKLLLFNENYDVVFEISNKFEEIVDEDGFPCEDLGKLNSWIFQSLEEIEAKKEFSIKAINFSAYGASFVYIDQAGEPIGPLYNYLKPYPEELKNAFYKNYGGEKEFSLKTASPVLGSLNSGMQLFRMKNKPEQFRQIKYALHLPQYLSYLLTKQPFSEITSIGCHTNLWDFQKNSYHNWVEKENINKILAPLASTAHVVSSSTYPSVIGIGAHDSSAALIPYLHSFHEPFILISTGTWCISLNPFNDTPLTLEELENDCLCYLSYKSKPVKASRLFAGNEHEIQVKRLSSHFNTSPDIFKAIEFNSELVSKLHKKDKLIDKSSSLYEVLKKSIFEKRDLNSFENIEEAYHQLIMDIAHQQFISTKLVLNGSSAKRIFVDGGFSNNPIYMNLVAGYYPDMEVYAASVPQSTALGAALLLHNHWNSKPLPKDLIKLKVYSMATTYRS